MESEDRAVARRRLDMRLAPFVDVPPPPPRGWLRAVREALGMRTVDVAARAGISQPSVTRAEQGEAEGTIQLDTLRRMAAAMDCVVVYAIVPRRSLQQTVEAQARRVAERELARVSRLMALEDQTPAATDAQELLEEHAARVLSERRDLWRDA